MMDKTKSKTSHLFAPFSIFFFSMAVMFPFFSFFSFPPPFFVLLLFFFLLCFCLVSPFLKKNKDNLRNTLKNNYKITFNEKQNCLCFCNF